VTSAPVTGINNSGSAIANSTGSGVKVKTMVGRRVEVGFNRNVDGGVDVLVGVLVGVTPPCGVLVGVVLPEGVLVGSGVWVFPTVSVGVAEGWICKHGLVGLVVRLSDSRTSPFVQRMVIV